MERQEQERLEKEAGKKQNKKEKKKKRKEQEERERQEKEELEKEEERKCVDDGEEWNDLENRIEQTGKRRSQRLLDQGNRNRTRVEEDWLRDSENWVRNSEGRNYGCPECGVWFFTSAAVHVHLDNKHNSPGENRNGTQEIPENA